MNTLLPDAGVSTERATRGVSRLSDSRTAIVFVCLVFHPDSSASSILFTDLFRRLANDGSRITVLTGFPSKDAGYHATLPRREDLDGIQIIRCGLRIQGKQSITARALAYSSFLLHAGWKLAWIGRRSRVVGGTDPPFTSIVLWLLSRLTRFDYECILLDIYPDGLVGLGRMRSSSSLTRVWRALNRRSYRAARRLTVIGRDMAALLQNRYGIDPGHIDYIPHWGSEEVECLEDVSQRPFLAQLGLTEKFVVQYSGNMGLWHDIDSIVRAAYLLRSDPHIHFLFIGKGRRRFGAEQLARRLGLMNITWLDFVPRSSLGESLLSCDAALVSLGHGLAGVAVPSKLYGILASGRPLIAQVPVESEVAYVAVEEHCGIVIEPGNDAGLAAAVQSLATDPDLVRTMGDNARYAYRTKYTIGQAAAAFETLWNLR
jgi:colanic acid biosynthesis glycosyl transferase WcaI